MPSMTTSTSHFIYWPSKAVDRNFTNKSVYLSKMKVKLNATRWEITLYLDFRGALIKPQCPRLRCAMNNQLMIFQLTWFIAMDSGDPSVSYSLAARVLAEAIPSEQVGKLVQAKWTIASRMESKRFDRLLTNSRRNQIKANSHRLATV